MKGLTSTLILLGITILFYAQPLKDSEAREPGVHEFVFVEEEPVPLNLSEVQSEIVYPAKALWNHIGGKMYLRILVSEEGKYEKHKVTRPIDPGLTAEAEKHLDKLRFIPAKRDNRPVKYWVNLPIVFNPKGNNINTQDLRHPVLFQQTLAHKLLSNNRKGDKYLTKGLDLMDEKNYAGAIETLSRCIRYTPRKPDSYPLLLLACYYRGKTYGKTGDWKNAHKDFTDAIGYLHTIESLPPEISEIGPAVFMDRALASMARGEEVMAMNDLCWVSRMFSADLWAHQDIFAAYNLSERDLSVCRRVLNRMRTIDPEDRLLKIQSENLLAYFLKEETPANPIMRVADRPETSVFSGKTQEAWLSVKTQNFEAAFATVAEILEEDPHNANAHLVKALTMVAIGADSEACPELDLALGYGLTEDKRERVLSLMQRICH
ncbi:MAG: TonB family protein [Bacteroidia bacterium]|nr:TonB family protein [Bacteroidia bacterium]